MSCLCPSSSSPPKALLCASWYAIPPKNMIAEAAGVVSQSNSDGSSTNFCSIVCNRSQVYLTKDWICCLVQELVNSLKINLLIYYRAYVLFVFFLQLLSLLLYCLWCLRLRLWCSFSSLLDELPVYRSTMLIWGFLCGSNMSLGVLSIEVYLLFLSLALTIEWLPLP